MDQLTKWQQIADGLNDEVLADTNTKLLTHYKGALRDVKAQAKKYIEEYETLSFSKRLEVQRLLGVGEQIQGILDNAVAKATGTIAAGTGKMAQNGYYSTFYGLEAANGLNIPMSILGGDFIEELVRTPVAGKVFSTRLYQNRTQLAKATTEALQQGAIDGKGYSYVAKRIEDLTEADYKKAIRIARTEGGRASSQAQFYAFRDAKNMGIDLKRQWVATLDDKTRYSHQEMDGQTVGEYEDFVSPTTGARGRGPRLLGHPGEDINCRCTTIAIVDDYDPELRRDNETGDHIKNMTYNEWLDFKGVPKTPPKITIPAVKAPPAPPKAPVATDTPKTLSRIDKATEEHIQGSPARKAAIKNSPEEVEKFQNIMRDMLDENDFAMRVPSDTVLEEILNSHFKNQLETGTSLGTLDAERRQLATRELFGLQYDDVKKYNPRDFEKYGYLAPRNIYDDLAYEGVEQYGGITVRFKKEVVSNRATFTVGDSLGSGLVASPVNNPTIASISGRDASKLRELNKALMDPKVPFVDKVEKVTWGTYIELQYHGNLTAKDIASVTGTRSEISLVIEKKLKDMGITVQIYD